MNNGAIQAFLLLRDTPDSLVKELVVPTRKFVKHKRVGVVDAPRSLLLVYRGEEDYLLIVGFSVSLGDRRMYAQ